MVKPSRIETLLFGRPALYRAKRFLIEVVLWRVVLAGIFRLKPNAMPDMTATFAGRRVLLAACGPGNASTGPLISRAAGVTAFDISPQFAVTCARSQPDWKVYCGDLLHLPHRNRAFDVSVLYSALHHLPMNAAEVLSELARTTDGQIVLVESVVPKEGLLRAALLLWYRLVDGGYHYYTLEELEGIFQRLGLAVQSKGLYSPIRHMLLAVLDCRGR
jgi:SAM-dependent methyltransferase